jgi:hypothetical protein
MHIYCFPVAQLVEQLTVNQWVTGSSPVRGASFSGHFKKIAKFKYSLWGTGGAVGNNKLQEHTIRSITMKKIYVILLTSLLTQPTFAEITFFNKSSQNNIEVTYQFCYTNNTIKTCAEPTTTIINSKNSSNQKNYVTTQPPTFPENSSPVILVLSAKETDNAGNIISKGNFSYGKEGYSSCGYGVYFNDIMLNIGISLDDENLSPIILCSASSY